MRILLPVLFLALIAASSAQGSTDSKPDGRFSHFSLDAADVHPPASDAANAVRTSDPYLASIPANWSAYAPMTGKAKFRLYLHSTYGPMSILSSAASAGIKQAYNSVPEWGQGMEGYGKRFASSFGRDVISQSAQLGLQYWMHEDPRYFAAKGSGMWSRAFYAAEQTFVAHKDSGGLRPGYSCMLAMATGVYVARRWYPAHDRTAEDYISSAATSIGLQAAKNIFSEFWPDIRKKLKR